MLVTVILVLGAFTGTNGIAKKDLDAYVWRIGNSLFNHSRTATKYRELHKKFELSDSKVLPVNLESIFSDVGKKMNESLRKKVDAIEKIMLFAEEKAFDQYKYNRSSMAVTVNVTFSKSLKVTLTPDEHFQTAVNTGFSSVHVPTSIYDRDKKLLEAVSWSSDLDDSFKSNYKENPTLSWQYFGSSTGFLRHYPARKWPNGVSDSGAGDDGEDLYDCRMRPWYVGAANSPKNIVILQDVSGSMTGLRSLIAKQVIHTVLDTLTENDFVNVYNFSSNSTALVDCFKDRLVQANLENIREFKIALGQGDNRGFADLKKGYETAFDILENNFNEESSSQCNQAIILITDGTSEYYKEIFDKRNPLKKIRVFTFLIGREVTDHREVLWMACYNQGFFAHISTMGEVQEKVLKYLPVMSRPLVMSEKHHVSWSPVYADLAEIIESDWQWEEKTKIRQKERSERYKTFYRTYVASRKNNASILADFVTQEEMEIAMNGKPPYPDKTKVKNFLDHGETNVSESLIRIMRAEKERNNIMIRHRWREYDRQFRQFSFVVSASIPVYDRRKTNSSHGNARIANFLGVVGTDIPIKELQKITSPFYLGVNGYAFAITNNGFIIFHPDWRPLYDDILKPNYNAVDITEVELLHSDDQFRNRGPSIIELRKAMIDKDTQNSSNSSILHIRSHSDDFRRVKIRKQQYAFGKIDGTLYTLVLTAPMNANRFEGQVEIWRLFKDRKPNANVTKYFDSPNTKHKWRLNPNWSYCEYIGSSDPKFNENKEVLLLHFLQRIQQSNYSWAWLATNATRPYICDKDLVQSLVFDAELTQKFAPNEVLLRSTVLGNATVMTFVATRSGLTRWIDFEEPESVNSDIPFITFYGRATEELWYRRAVDWNDIDEEIFVYSVPFDAGTRSFAQITATQAIFVKKGLLKAPVAVVGIQYDMDKVIALLDFSLPSGRGDVPSQNFCQGDEYDCLLLDENGFIIISENREEIGQFFGEVNGKVMDALLKAGVYDEIAVTDFQAVCLHPLKRTSFADILATPFQHIKWILRWSLGRLAWLILQSNLHMFINPDYASVLAEIAESGEAQEIPEGSMPYIDEASVPKTKLRRCDKKYNLYTFGSEYIPSNGSYRRVGHDDGDQSCDDFLNVRRVPRSNLLLVVVQSKCRSGNQKLVIEGIEIKYPMHPDFVGRTESNPILSELCRIPYTPMHRKRTSTCYEYNEEENDMGEDCGNGSMHLELTFFWILTTVLVQVSITVHYFN